MRDWLNKTHIGDCRELLKEMAADGVRAQTCVTSPPYFGLRDYGCAGQLGLEPTPADYVAELASVFDAVHEVLADDGTLWLNIGDSYASGGGTGKQGKRGQRFDRRHTQETLMDVRQWPEMGIKPKDLIGIPWRVAFALQASGWYLRSDIIWHKPNPMPESVTDRPTKAHEYVFLLTKSERYYYDSESIAEPAIYGGDELGIMRVGEKPRAESMGRAPSGNEAAAVRRRESKKRGEFNGKTNAMPGREAFRAIKDTRNKRTVWTVPTQPFAGAHFACFPRALIEPCILAGAGPGATVLDPFMGSGTTGQVATDLGRQFIGCELNPAYVELHDMRRTTIGMGF